MFLYKSTTVGLKYKNLYQFWDSFTNDKSMLKYACLLSILVLALVPKSLIAQSTNAKIAMAWIDALNKHDLDALALMYADGIQLESPNWEGTKTGKAEAKETYRRYFSTTPDLRYELTHFIETPIAIVIEYISSGTFKNPENGTPEYMRGKKYSLKNCMRMDLQAGKMSRLVNYFDQVAFLRQVGFFDQSR
jgi:steroid delta-isomerase-like uncharacterized protein